MCTHHICFSIHLLTDTLIASLCWQLYLRLLWTLGHMYLFKLGSLFLESFYLHEVLSWECHLFLPPKVLLMAAASTSECCLVLLFQSGEMAVFKLYPWWLRQKESPCNTRDTDSIPVSGRSPGKGNGNPLQYPCLENPMDRGTWWATIHGVAKSQTALSDWAHIHIPSKAVGWKSFVKTKTKNSPHYLLGRNPF